MNGVPRCVRLGLVAGLLLAVAAVSAPAQTLGVPVLPDLPDEPPPLAAAVQRRLDALEARNADLAKKVEALSAPVKKAEPKKAEPKKDDAPKEWLVGNNLQMNGTWRDGLGFETPDKAFRYSVGGVMQIDSAFYGANPNLVRSVGSFDKLADPGLALSDGVAFRRARLRLSGQMWEQFDFFSQFDFAQALDLRRGTLGITGTGKTQPDFEPVDATFFNEVYLGANNVPYLGQVRIGHHREALNFALATSNRFLPFMERPLLFEAFNGDFNFSTGLTLQQAYLDERAVVWLGMFQSNSRNFAAVGDGEYAYDLRATALPIWNPDDKHWAHIGVDYSYRNLHMNQTRYRARDLVRAGTGFDVPLLVNTGTIFSRDAQQIANLELASAWGRWTFTTEAAVSWVTNAFSGGLPLADGTLPDGAKARGTYVARSAYAEALYFLTPDHRGYRKDRPGYDRVVPRSNFFFLRGANGPLWNRGAWEIGARYDYLDLTDSGINGGTLNAVTVALNWYLNPNMRLMWNYVYTHRDFDPTDNAGRVAGDIHGLGMRVQWDF